MEYVIEKDSKVKKLSLEDKSHIAHRIVIDFKTYNDSRQRNLSMANELIAEVFFKKDLSKETGTLLWLAESIL